MKYLVLLLVAALICVNKSFAQTGSLFNFIRSVEITPDTVFLTGSFARINYIPATDHFVVTFGTKASTEEGICKGAGYAFKEYSLDMEETGYTGLLDWYADACEAGDAGSTLAGNTYYFVDCPQELGLPYGLRVTKFAADDWTRLGEKYVYMIETHEANSDPCVAFVNGQLDISDQYNPSGIWQEGTASRHHFYSPDLDSLTVRILDDSPNISGASMIHLDGIYNLISANAYAGDLVVLNYDNAWNYLGMKKLVDQANWSQGVTTDGIRFYVAYQDTRLRTDPWFFPVCNNIHLAAFDLEWNLIDDVAVTDFDTTDHAQTGRPWVIMHNNLVYVSYDLDSIDTNTHEEMKKWQARVSIYELNPEFSSITNHEGTESEFQLEQNYPNPCSSLTSITFSIPSQHMVTLKVVDIYSREIAVLVNETISHGKHTVTFDVTGVPNGTYFYQLVAGDIVQTRKCLILK